ncbi:glycosyltransferase family 4 protein [Ornithinimicrobium pratense]|uniref:D-inositol 3-phosphate glycosyltransferase n=1 Tax=Ornithinimicrobium pratense TaxID=2593973 RepID=A0A5J6V4D6_9MICO|nr:glycosyltransferase family 4 protein [Ornithinimicrobium pratense]QFG68507.1 glycosyltransferase family 4 protein [Ornithinimicrobium pratense]
MASESDISVQGHGVHTAYIELADALERRDDITLVRGRYRSRVECDVYHLHTIGAAMWRKLRDPRAKKVVSAHVIPDSLVGSIRLARHWRPVARRYMQWFYTRADKVLAVSSTVARALEDELKVPKDRIEVLHNTIDMQAYRTTPRDRAAARQRLQLAQDAFVVVGVGQVQPRKRVDVFHELARQQPGTVFIWVGGIPFKHLGAEHGSMRRLVERAPDNLLVTGVLPHPQVKTYLQAADVFCLPAEQENHPMCILEAAGVGLPIVARDLPEYDDTFGDDLLRCADDTFAAAISLLRADRCERARWRQRSARIANRFDSSAAAERLVGIYRDLASPSRTTGPSPVAAERRPSSPDEH